jgi:hypothetical protein
MNEIESQPWYQLHASAVVEVDRERLIERVNAAEEQFTVACRICSTMATTMKSGNLWKTRTAP